MTNKPILICTFLALSSGFFGGFVGGKISLILDSQKCQNQSWGFKEMCHTFVAPGAVWQGSTAGFWTGSILGAFVGGSVTKNKV